MKKTTFLNRSLLYFLLISMVTGARGQVTELKFRDFSEADANTSESLQSLLKVRGIGEQYATGGLYLMTFKGDFDSLFQRENQKAIDLPMITEPWRFCSVFSAKNEEGVFMGRNWDNQNVGSIIVSLYKPAVGYASVSFSRAIDMGFPLNVDLEDMVSGPFAGKLLLAPFYTNDGMNESGLCMAIAGIRQVQVKPQAGKELVFVNYFLRNILDRASTVEEAVTIAERYIPFDIDKNSLNCHFFIADSLGRSAILEYRDDKWEIITPGRPWQVMTNRVIYGTPEATLREKCRRYNVISGTLEGTNGTIDRQSGLQLLQAVAQNGTTWSVLYSPSGKDLHFSVYQSWDKVYHIQGF